MASRDSAVVSKMEDDLVKKEAVAVAAVAHAESQRAKVNELQKKLTFEDERGRRILEPKSQALQKELERRERVAKQAAEDVNSLRIQLNIQRRAAATAAAARHIEKQEDKEKLESSARDEKSQSDGETTPSPLRQSQDAVEGPSTPSQTAKDEMPAKHTPSSDAEDWPPAPSAQSPKMISSPSFNSALVGRWAAAEERWESFASLPPNVGGIIGLEDVPWPDMTVIRLAMQIHPHLIDLKALQMRWRPDEFMQSHSSRLKEKDREAVFARVMRQADALDALAKASEPSSTMTNRTATTGATT